MLKPNPNISTDQLDGLESQKAYLQEKISELISYGEDRGFCFQSDPYVDIAISNLQLALNEVNRILYVEA